MHRWYVCEPSADWFDFLFDASSLLTEGSHVILLVWLTLANPASPFCAHLTWENGLAEVGFLKEPRDKQDERQWKAGTYRGITVGKSTAADVLQKWGKPKWSGHSEWDDPKNPKFLLYDYDTQEALLHEY